MKKSKKGIKRPFLKRRLNVENNQDKQDSLNTAKPKEESNIEIIKSTAIKLKAANDSLGNPIGNIIHNGSANLNKKSKAIAIVLILIAIAYTILPADLVPDTHKIVTRIDDMAAICLALANFKKSFRNMTKDNEK